MQFVIESHEAELLRGILASTTELCKKLTSGRSTPGGIRDHAQTLYVDSRTLQAMFGWAKKEQG